MTALRLISKEVFNMWDAIRKNTGDIPAKSVVAKHYGITSKDVNDCIKYCEKGKIKLTAKAKDYSGKVTSKDCEELWKKYCLKRAGYKCEKCQSTEVIQVHHIIPRTNWSLRFDETNGVALCKYHHLFWAHKDTTDFTRWIATKRDLNYLESKRNNRTKHDYNAIALYLQQKIKEFNQKKAA